MSARSPFDVSAGGEPRVLPPRLVFGPFIADPSTGRLMEGDRVVVLTPQPFETLCYLARCAGRVVPKAELMGELWRNTSVTDNVLAQCVADIRRALGDTATSPQYVQTLPRRGYRFVAPVRVLAAEGPAEKGRASASARARRLAIPLAVSMAVLAAAGGGLALHRAARRTVAAPAEIYAPADSSFAWAYVKKAELQQWRRQADYGSPGASVPRLMLEALMRQGRWEDMIRIGLTQLASSSISESQKAMVSSFLAEAYRHKGEFGPAIESARRAVLLWPSQDTPEWLRQKDTLGRIRLDGGQRDEAVDEFRAIAAAPAADADNLTHAAWGLYLAGERVEAMSLVERALKQNQAHGNAYHLRGWIRMATGDYSRAALDLERAYEKTPPQFGGTHHGHLGGDLAALYYAGVSWQKAGRAARAKAVLGQVVDHCRTLERHFGDEPGAAARWQAANFIGRVHARLGSAVSEPPRLPDDDTTYFVQSARLDAVRGLKSVALRRLAQGLALGFRERRHMLDDPDFESLRGEPEFRRLVIEPLSRLSAGSPAH